jgi:hypothetical protein
VPSPTAGSQTESDGRNESAPAVHWLTAAGRSATRPAALIGFRRRGTTGGIPRSESGSMLTKPKRHR